MPRGAGQFDDYYNVEEQKILVEKFGTSDKKELKKLIHQYVLSPSKTSEDPKTVDEKLKKVKLANETLKAWKEIRSSGGTVDDLERLVNYGEIPSLENNYERGEIQTTTEEKPKLEFQTFGKTIINKPKKILQEDGTLRCMQCNHIIDMRAYDFEQLDDYRKHVEQAHGKLYESERKELMGIYEN